MSDYSFLVIDNPEPWICVITLDNPDMRNAISTPVLSELAHALSCFAEWEHIRCVIVTGGRKVFAAGADIREMAAHDAVSILDDERPKLWAVIRNFPKPLVAAVNGYALGAGCELAMHADIVIAGSDALFGQPEINLGIIPGAGGTQRLVRSVGKALAMKMILTGEPIDAPTAFSAGLVSEITPADETLTRALAIASTVASKPPLAAKQAKAAVLCGFVTTLDEGLAEERARYVTLFGTEDRREGIAAFFGKRKPQFHGR